MHPTTLLLADEGWHGGPWFLLIPVFWLLVLVVFFTVLRRTAWRRGWRPGCVGGPAGGPESPLAVLGRRYAQGEIDEDEYRARRSVLAEGHEPGGPTGGAK